jgi:hypothetical protein
MRTVWLPRHASHRQLAVLMGSDDDNNNNTVANNDDNDNSNVVVDDSDVDGIADYEILALLQVGL